MIRLPRMTTSMTSTRSCHVHVDSGFTGFSLLSDEFPSSYGDFLYYGPLLTFEDSTFNAAHARAQHALNGDVLDALVVEVNGTKFTIRELKDRFLKNRKQPQEKDRTSSITFEELEKFTEKMKTGITHKEWMEMYTKIWLMCGSRNSSNVKFLWVWILENVKDEKLLTSWKRLFSYWLRNHKYPFLTV